MSQALNIIKRAKFHCFDISGASMPPYMMAMGPAAYPQGGAVRVPYSGAQTPTNQSLTQVNIGLNNNPKTS